MITLYFLYCNMIFLFLQLSALYHAPSDFCAQNALQEKQRSFLNVVSNSLVTSVYLTVIAGCCLTVVAVCEKEDHIKNCNSSYKKDYLRLIVLHHLTLTHDILLNLEFYTIFCMCKEENSISMTWIKKNCQRNHLDLFIDLYHQYSYLFIETETITFYVKA